MKPQSSQSNSSLCAQKKFPHKDITGRIIASAIEVHSRLGPGLLESVYEEALVYEFELSKVAFERPKEITLIYKGHVIGKYRIDFLVENELIVELKAAEAIHSIYEAQVLTYLRALGKRVGLLINFNVVLLKEGIRRFIV